MRHHPKFKKKNVAKPKFYVNTDKIQFTNAHVDSAMASNDNKIFNINKTQTVKKLKKKQRRLQRSISRKYNINKGGDSYCKTSNIIKSEKQLLKLNQQLPGYGALYKTVVALARQDMLK